jgi:hypothetical protein
LGSIEGKRGGVMADKYEMCIVHPSKGVMTMLFPGKPRKIIKLMDFIAEQDIQGDGDYYDAFGSILDDSWEPYAVFEWAYFFRRKIEEAKETPTKRKNVKPFV